MQKEEKSEMLGMSFSRSIKASYLYPGAAGHRMNVAQSQRRDSVIIRLSENEHEGIQYVDAGEHL